MSERAIGMYALKINDDMEFPDEEALERIGNALADRLDTGKPVILGPGMELRRIDVSPSEIQMERLLTLLSLTDQERAFVRAALGMDQGKDFWNVLADYVEEQGSDAAGRFQDIAEKVEAQEEMMP